MEQAALVETNPTGNFIKFLRRILGDGRLIDVSVDSDELIAIHRKILHEKPMMRGVFREMYDTCMQVDAKYFTGEGSQVELGAGVSFFKDCYPQILTTDIKAAQHLDMRVDALAMPFEDRSVRAFYGINCFHHFPEPERFFNELTRTLLPGGGCVLIEPYYGFCASRFFKRVFATESFNPNQKTWKCEGIGGVMHGANQALAYIVFIRDRALFLNRFPELEIVETVPFTSWLRYFLSGGLNFRQLLPSVTVPALKILEKIIFPLRPFFALHYRIVIRKRSVG